MQLLVAAGAVPQLEGWVCNHLEAYPLICLVIGEVSIGSDGQDTFMCHLHVAVWLSYKVVARLQG